MRVSLAFLLLTLVVGTLLRAVLAGWGTLGPLSFADVRHAHSHLGYFAVLFPLAWVAMAQAGNPVPGPRLRGVYFGGAAVAFAGFLRGGYTFEAIVGSTLVGGVWLVFAWQNRRALGQLHSFVSNVGPGVLLASGFIPPIAVYTSKDAALAQRLVQTFLFLLLFGALLPVVLRKVRARPPPWPVWTAAGFLAALNFGVSSDMAWTGIGPVGLAACIFFSVSAPGVTWLDRSLFAASGLGVLLMGLRLLDNARDIALAGVHFAILGPFLTPFFTRFRRPWAVGAAAMGAALLLPRVGLAPFGQPAATAVGAALCVLCAAELAASKNRE